MALEGLLIVSLGTVRANDTDRHGHPMHFNAQNSDWHLVGALGSLPESVSRNVKAHHDQAGPSPAQPSPTQPDQDKLPASINLEPNRRGRPSASQPANEQPDHNGGQLWKVYETRGKCNRSN